MQIIQMWKAGTGISKKSAIQNPTISSFDGLEK